MHKNSFDSVHAHLRQTQRNLLRLVVGEGQCDLRIRDGQPQQELLCISYLMHGPVMQCSVADSSGPWWSHQTRASDEWMVPGVRHLHSSHRC